MVYSEIFHNDDTFHAYNEAIVRKSEKMKENIRKKAQTIVKKV